jgi:hypothetical protein
MSRCQPDKTQIEPAYQHYFDGLPRFSTLAVAEDTLRRLENLRQDFAASSDKRGVEYCRNVALLGRRRAEAISRNRRVAAEKRLLKKEVADWFRIWLESPEIFQSWLALRRKTVEFASLLRYENDESCNG